ncbi:uncharacterized protein VTP21DRAFT_5389 [Calcarisporiella thermophila]|uniref:uncharacterized protein n=1 Tax=Calcarisporiella thermophila TaxID=911321 RepID=UPI003742DE55
MKRAFLTCILLGSLTSATLALTPQKRWGHGAALVDNKLYLYGGMTVEATKQSTNELLVLDMTQSFALGGSDYNFASEPSSTGPAVAFPGFSVGGPGNKHLYLYGGNISEPSPFYYYNTVSGTWNHPEGAVLPDPRRRQGRNMVSHLSDGKLYVWAGEDPNTENPVTNELWLLDTTQSPGTNFVRATASGAPNARVHHGLVMVGDNIYVIGGAAGKEALVEMSRIDCYNVRTSSWTTLTAGGALPAPRQGHSTVATHDGKIILFGGSNADYSTYYSDIAVLDTTQNPPTWSAPTTQGTKPAGRQEHSCTMAGTRMVCAFGQIKEGESDVGDNTIFALDTNTWTWLTQYTPDRLDLTAAAPPASTSPSSSPPSATKSGSAASPQTPADSAQNSAPTSTASSDLKSGSSPAAGNGPSVPALAGGITGGVVGLAALGAAIFLFIRRSKRKQHDEFYSVPFESVRRDFGKPPISIGRDPALYSSASVSDVNDIELASSHRNSLSGPPLAPASYEGMQPDHHRHGAAGYEPHYRGEEDLGEQARGYGGGYGYGMDKGPDDALYGRSHYADRDDGPGYAEPQQAENRPPPSQWQVRNGAAEWEDLDEIPQAPPTSSSHEAGHPNWRS